MAYLLDCEAYWWGGRGRGKAAVLWLHWAFQLERPGFSEEMGVPLTRPVSIFLQRIGQIQSFWKPVEPFNVCVNIWNFVQIDQIARSVLWERNVGDQKYWGLQQWMQQTVHHPPMLCHRGMHYPGSPAVLSADLWQSEEWRVSAQQQNSQVPCTEPDALTPPQSREGKAAYWRKLLRGD